MKKFLFLLLNISILSDVLALDGNKIIALQTDFGYRDGAISALKGEILKKDKEIKIIDVSHDIQAFDVREAGYTLYQTAFYWPNGTTFVSVIDPGVGTDREPIVAKAKNNAFYVAPNNGLLSYIAKYIGIEEVRIIDKKYRATNAISYTFDGRDLFGQIGAKLADNQITFEQVGKKLPEEKFKINKINDPIIKSDNEINGEVATLDWNYGNVWSNIPSTYLKNNREAQFLITIKSNKNGKVKFKKLLPYCSAFGEQKINKELLYVNSIGNLSMGINCNNFAKKYNIALDDLISIKIIK